MIDAKIRFNLVRGANMKVEDEPTARQRGIRVYDELKKRGWDAGRWDGWSTADVIVGQYSPISVQQAIPFCDYVIWDCNDALFLPHHCESHLVGPALDDAAWVTTGSERIAEHLRARTGGSPCISYMPEAIDSMYATVKRAPEAFLTIMWMGMQDNLVYIDDIDPMLSALAAQFEFEVVFVCPAHTGAGGSNVAAVGSKPYETRHVVWTPKSVVKEMCGAAIAIVPLYQCEWCWCKSANKAATFAAVGIPTVASDVPPYREFIEHGVNGYLAFSPNDWYDPLKLLLESEKLRKKIGSAGKKTASKRYSISAVADEWERVLTRVLT